LKDVFINLPLAIYSCRWTVRNIFPALTKAARSINKEEVINKQSNGTSDQYRYKMPGRKFRSNWKYHQKSSFGDKIMVGLVMVVTKTRLITSVKVKVPDSLSNKEFSQSFKHTVEELSRSVKNINANIDLVNYDFDTGKKSEFGEYALADNCYRKLTLKLYNKQKLPIDLKKNVLDFYKNNNINDRKLNRALGCFRKMPS
jgi:hypothetical protein